VKSWLRRVWSHLTTPCTRRRVSSSHGVSSGFVSSQCVSSHCVELLEGRELLTVTFNGGELLPHVEVQALYYGSKWSTDPQAHAQSQQFDTYLNYLVGSPYMTALSTAGYNVGTGTAQAGVTDNTVLKGHRITDGKLRSAVQADIDSGVLAAPDANRLYVIFVQPGTIVKAGFGTSVRSFLGYHDHFKGHDAQGKSHDIRYAVLPYQSRPNAVDHSAPDQFGSMTSTISHEVAEAATDPVPGDSWYDNDFNGEIADLTDSSVTLDGYYVQQFVGKDGKTPVPIPGASS
jgi:hypothetical protein